MSLFEDPLYQWRETYFVFFDRQSMPSAEQLKDFIQSLGKQIEIANVTKRDDGSLEALTVYAPDDFAAMDISCALGSEVTEQLPQLVNELRKNCQTDDERQQLKQIAGCDARIDIFHFEHIESTAAHEENLELIDPGGLLMVLDGIGELCQGFVVDPQSSSLL